MEAEYEVKHLPAQIKKWNSRYADAVEYVYENGLMNGVAEGTFKPYGSLSRAMICLLYTSGDTGPAMASALILLLISALSLFLSALLDKKTTVSRADRKK